MSKNRRGWRRNLRRLSPLTGYLLMTGGQAFAWSMGVTMFMVYQVEVVKMNPFQLVIAGTVLEATYFLFEVPTGVVADMVSRRLSLAIGLALLGVGLALTGAVAVFEVLLVAQVIAAIGFTFISGSGEAWIVDEIGQEAAGQAFLRGSQVGSAGGILGILAAAPLALIGVGVPLVVGGALLGLVALFVILTLPEEGFTPSRHKSGSVWQTMRGTVSTSLSMIRLRPVLLTLVGLSAIVGMFSEGYDRLWAAHLIQDFTLPALRLPLAGPLDPVVWFSLIGVVSALLTLAVTEIVRRRVNVNDQRAAAWALGILYALIAAGLAVFALTGSLPLALVSIWLIDTARGVSAPIHSTWINQHIDSSVRATVISMTDQSNAIGQIAGGPVVGWIGTVRSIRAALVTSALILTPSLPILARTGRMHIGGEVDSPLPAVVGAIPEAAD